MKPLWASLIALAVAAPAVAVDDLSQAFESARIDATAPRPPAAIDTAGASITAGTGAEMPLAWRIRSHLAATDGEPGKRLGDKRVLVAYDYFFPTNFRKLDGSPADAENAARQTIEDWLRQYDYILVGDLIQKEQLSDQARAMLERPSPSNSRYKNLWTIHDLLYQKSPNRAESAAAVNRVLRAAAENHPGKVIIVENAALMNAVDMRRGGYVLPAISMDDTREAAMFNKRTVSPGSLFSDDIHFNGRGQAFLFNQALAPALRRIPELKGHVSEMLLVAPSFYDVKAARRAEAGKSSDFANGKPGTYWGMIEGMSQLRYLVQSALGTELSNPFAKANARQHTPAQGDPEASVLKNFEAIRGVIALGSVLAEDGLAIQLKPAASGTSIGLDLTQVMFYKLIFLEPTAQNDHVGYGYDYWLSVDKNEPPWTNYEFKAKRDAEDPARLHVVWRIFPPLKVDGALQPKGDERQTHLDSPWKEEIISKGEQYPYLEYSLTVRIIDP